MKYLRKTINLPLILGAGGTGILKWWIHASFEVHPNTRGHTYGGLLMRRGLPVVTSTKQNLITQSSAEADIFGVDDCMQAVCWTRYFLEAQDYNVTEKIIYQDNKSALLIEENGKD